MIITTAPEKLGAVFLYLNSFQLLQINDSFMTVG